MTGIQLLLITGVIMIVIFYIQRFHKALISVVLISLFAVAAVVFILNPELTNRIAQAIGVGRGADLLFYLSILFFLFLILKLYARVRKLEIMVTELVRRQALDETCQTPV